MTKKALMHSSHTVSASGMAIVAHEDGWVIYFVDDGKKTPAEQVFEAARGARRR
jgi:hypothetical protein